MRKARRCLNLLRAFIQYRMEQCKKCRTNPAAKDRQFCSACLEVARNKANERVAMLRKSGTCIACGKSPAATNSIRCNECTVHRRKKKHARLASRFKLGMCRDCSEPRLENCKCCKRCSIKRVARNTLGNVKLTNAIERLFDQQNGICPYTGDKLIFGKTASLDHKIPRHAGGSHDVSNLQWVRLDVNIIKNAHSEANFLRIIGDVASYRLKMKKTTS